MKITFTDMQQIAQEIIGLTDPTTLITIKRDINIGASLFVSSLGRDYNRRSKFTDLVANQQYYQLPEDGHKLKEIIADSGGWEIPLEQIPDERTWRKLNSTPTVGQPSHYFVRGYDEVGIYPIPAATTPVGLELVFSPKHTRLTQDDYLAGTVTVTEGSATVIGATVNFSSNLAGQWLEVTDGSDANWYKIAERTNSTTLQLENFYQGPTGSGRTYRIGEVADLPEEFLEAPVDYACYRHYLKRRSREEADLFLKLFKSAQDEAKNNYSTTSDNQVVSLQPEYRTYNPFRGDPPTSITG